MSATARHVAFASKASNLVPGDTNGVSDIFVRDRVAGVTRRISVGAAGVQGNRASFGPAISADGRYVAFESDARNLVAGDTNASTDVFVRDRVAHVTRLVSGGRGSAQGNDDTSYRPSISANGRYVAFRSAASNLVRHDTNHAYDVFVWERATGATRRVSIGRRSAQANSDSGEPTISPNGRYVAFQSEASNLVAGDTNLAFDVFVRDRSAGVTQRVSVGPGAVQGDGSSFNPSISDNGRFVAFTSAASNLVSADNNHNVDVFVRDRSTGVTQRTSIGAGGEEANAFSGEPDISGSGRFVALMSRASNLVPGDTNGASDVFVAKRGTGAVQLVSAGRRGGRADGESYRPAISTNGRFVGFMSRAANLVAGDTNNEPDVFLSDLRR
jgi:Tol biopolymer transport system component